MNNSCPALPESPNRPDQVKQLVQNNNKHKHKHFEEDFLERSPLISHSLSCLGFLVCRQWVSARCLSSRLVLRELHMFFHLMAAAVKTVRSPGRFWEQPSISGIERGVSKPRLSCTSGVFLCNNHAGTSDDEYFWLLWYHLGWNPTGGGKSLIFNSLGLQLHLHPLKSALTNIITRGKAQRRRCPGQTVTQVHSPHFKYWFFKTSRVLDSHLIKIY